MTSTPTDGAGRLTNGFSIRLHAERMTEQLENAAVFLVGSGTWHAKEKGPEIRSLSSAAQLGHNFASDYFTCLASA